MHLAIGAATFVALLTPAAPLAAAFLLATDAMAVAGAVMQIFTTGTVVQVFLLAQGVPLDTWKGTGPADRS